jgi:hypothetical protein
MSAYKDSNFSLKKMLKQFFAYFKFYNNIFVILLFFGILFLSGCKTGLPKCYDDRNKNLVIRWGEYYNKADLFKGYQIDSKGLVSNIEKSGKDKNYKMTDIGLADGNRYCYAMGMLRYLFLKIQTLNEPGDTVRFIEYYNPDRNSNTKAIWNPVYKTAGSEGYRDAYDSLQALVPKIESKDVKGK